MDSPAYIIYYGQQGGNTLHNSFCTKTAFRASVISTCRRPFSIFLTLPDGLRRCIARRRSGRQPPATTGPATTYHLRAIRGNKLDPGFEAICIRSEKSHIKGWIWVSQVWRLDTAGRWGPSFPLGSGIASSRSRWLRVARCVSFPMLII